MTNEIREALEKQLDAEWEKWCCNGGPDAWALAPLVERALRAAYLRGWSDFLRTYIKTTQEDNGVAAGIAALQEEPE